MQSAALRKAAKLRNLIFRPYRKGRGPSFKLETWDAGSYDSRGCPYIGYRLSARPGGVLFEGEDFSPGMGTASDSEECMAGLMSFLTLCPGDTDKEYFDNYTAAQLAFCDNHAEALSCEVVARLGEY